MTSATTHLKKQHTIRNTVLKSAADLQQIKGLWRGTTKDEQ